MNNKTDGGAASGSRGPGIGARLTVGTGLAIRARPRIALTRRPRVDRGADQ
ncbi:hypothetical protein [uncultured Parasphingopyxis sp.]|uniref:hypothetical protein n=1 Tax=uncultured Parasphingopyxis sp. TaxID=1547918 RepID=UPI00262C545E|nr:hypothetical protein [uncultured Parasphingopyxis sp.]